jgi:hypothetical protein
LEGVLKNALQLWILILGDYLFLLRDKAVTTYGSKHSAVAGLKFSCAVFQLLFPVGNKRFNKGVGHQGKEQCRNGKYK